MPLRILALLVAGLGLARAGDPPALTVAHAGSISAGLKAVAELYTQRTGVKVVEIAGGSVSLARRIAAGKVECDLYASADFENIDQMLKPAGLADFTLRIAQGAMVLAYTTGSRNAATIAASGPFQPPASVPAAAADWYAQVTQPGVHIAGAHPFLDPGGYRADLIFQLAQDLYQVPNLYDDLLSHLVIGSAPGGLGTAFDYQIIYEHSAVNASRKDPAYRFVRLPEEINLGSSAQEARYARRSVTMPGLQSPGATGPVTIPGSRVTWGITLLKAASHREQALAFLQLLCSDEGAALLDKAGPAAIHPAVASREDLARLPAALKPLVTSAPR